MDDSLANSTESLQEMAGRLQRERDQAVHDLQAHVAASSDAIVHLHHRDQIAFWNLAAEKFFGWQAEETQGKRIGQFISPTREADNLLMEIDRCLGDDRVGQNTQRKRATWLDQNDIMQPITYSVQPRDDGQSDRCSLVFCVAADHESAVQALFDQQGEQKALLQYAAEGIYGVNTAGECTFANKACGEILGYDPSELVGQHMHNLIHHTDNDGKPLPQEQCLIYKAFRAGETIHVDDELFWKKDGTAIPVEYWSLPIRRDGKWVGTVVTFVDIQLHQNRQLAQMRANRQLAQQVDASENELAQINDRLDQTLRKADVGLWDWNAVTDEVYYSSTFKTQLGYSEEVDWHDLDVWKSHLHPNDFDAALQRVQECFDKKQTDYRSKFRLRCADGSYRWILAQGNADFAPDGRPVRMIGVHVDITDQVHNELEMERLNNALLISNEALRTSNAELKQFASVASHDLQAPLRAITGFAQILLEDYKGKFDDTADDYLQRIVRNSKRMQSLIDDLLAFSRAESHVDQFGQVNLDACVIDALVMLELPIESTGAIITSDELPTVFGDAFSLTQLFQNLIDNAIKYHENDQPKIHISAKRHPVSPETNDQEWIIAVKDNGIGMAQENLERIFEIFRRLHSQNQYSGSGIGLALCRRIVSRHGGRIWAESEQGQGSTFYFTIPIEAKKK